MRYRVFLILLFTSFSCSVKQVQNNFRKNQRPNILFINADDWGLHAGVYGDKTARTPFFDSLAQQGALFDKAFVTSPSCTPSRASMLTGRYPHQLEAGANLWSYLPKKFPVYPELLAKAGYATGYAEKGWGPGGGWLPGWPSHEEGYANNPAGKLYEGFDIFLDSIGNKPFCFWWGIKEPHRPYKRGIGEENGYSKAALDIPAFLPSTDDVKTDLLDYYYYVEVMDKKFRTAFDELKKRGLLENTLVIITSDNGMPFNRAKTNLYDHGTNVPLLLYWKGKIAPVRYKEELVSLIDIYATMLRVAGLPEDKTSPSKDLLALLDGSRPFDTAVFFEREFHAQPGPDNVLPKPEGFLSYPMRGVRTKEYLLIKNYRPERYPSGSYNWQSAAAGYANHPQLRHLTFDRRPSTEFYQVRTDSFQLQNIAANVSFDKIQQQLAEEMKVWQLRTGDPRFTNDDNRWDHYPLYRSPSQAAGQQ